MQTSFAFYEDNDSPGQMGSSDGRVYDIAPTTMQGCNVNVTVSRLEGGGGGGFKGAGGGGGGL